MDPRILWRLSLPIDGHLFCRSEHEGSGKDHALNQAGHPRRHTLRFFIIDLLSTQLCVCFHEVMKGSGNYLAKQRRENSRDKNRLGRRCI